MSDAPCKVCGYNGPGFYQPDIHACPGNKNWNRRADVPKSDAGGSSDPSPGGLEAKRNRRSSPASGTVSELNYGMALASTTGNSAANQVFRDAGASIIRLAKALAEAEAAAAWNRRAPALKKRGPYKKQG